MFSFWPYRSREPPRKVSEDPIFSVQGQVSDSSGRALAGYLVEAYDVDLRHEQCLGNAKTSLSTSQTSPSAQANYLIKYTSSSFRRSEKGSADLRVKVFSPQRTSDPNCEPVAVSDILFNAPVDAVVDIVVPSVQGKTPCEFDLLVRDIEPLLDGAKFVELVEDDTHHDISFLAGETAQDATKIRNLAAAFKASAATQTVIGADLFYGIYRQNISSNPTAFITLDIDAIMQALQKSIDENLINQRTSKELDDIRTLFVNQISKISLSDPDNLDKPSPLHSVLISSNIEQPQRFVDALSNHSGPIEDFWKKLDADPEFKGKTESMQFGLQLGMLTLNHLPLLQELQNRKQKGEITSVRDLAGYSEKTWLEILQNKDIGVPDIITGSDQMEKTQKMATAMSQLLEDAFPTTFVAARLSDPEDDTTFGPLTTKPDLATFFKANPEFDLKTTRLAEYLILPNSTLNGVKDPDALQKSIQTIQRIYTIAPRYTQMRILVADGVTSSLQISTLARSTFQLRYADKLGGEADALHIYERAQKVNATASTILMQFGFVASKIRPVEIWDGALASMDINNKIPDLSTLFGDMDMCVCDGCSGRTVDGPAAYFVDILHFLRNRDLVESVVRTNGKITKVNYVQHTVDGKQVTKTAKDVLFVRRPDLGEIELNCANTNTPVPYIDLCVEILEDAVNPQSSFNPLNLPDGTNVDLDMKQFGTWRSLFTPPLSDFAIITVLKAGESWTIDEPSFSYNIRKQDDGTTKVLTRSRQTKGTAAERAATPQYQNSGAYDKLYQQVFPVLLPFDMWTETIRTYLAHITITRAQIMETRSKNPRRELLSDPTISFEILGLTPANADVITNTITGQPGSATAGPWDFWGFEKEVEDGSSNIPDPSSVSALPLSGEWNVILLSRVDLFLQQGGLEYRELLNVLQFVAFLRPLENELALPRIQAREGEPQDTCELQKLEIRGLSANDLINIHAFIRLARCLANLGWSLIDVGQAYAQSRYHASQSGAFVASPAGFLIDLSNIQRLRGLLSDVPIKSLLAFWTPISAFAFKDYNDDSGTPLNKSLYAEVFRNEATNIDMKPSFPENPANLSGSITDFQDALIASLNVSASDLSSLQSQLSFANDNMNLQNLSQLYRHSVLAHGLEVSVSDYLVLLKLIESNPFLSPASTVEFVEKAQNLLRSDFSLPELNYLLRHDFEVKSGIQPSDADIASFFETFRDEQRTIELNNTHSPETTIEEDVTFIRKKLSELGLDDSVVTEAVSILDGTASYAIALSGSPPSSLVSSTVGDKCTYNPETGLLSYAGIMTVADQQTLKSLPQASTAFTDAVDSLFNLPRKFLRAYLGDFYPVEVQTLLSMMPTTFSLPVELRKKLYYDQNTSTLHCIGALSPSELQALWKAMSKSDPTTVADFQDALVRLSKASETAPRSTENTFLASSDISELFDTTTLDGLPTSPQGRIQYVLLRLLPALLAIQTKQAVIAGLCQAMSLEGEICQMLVSYWLHIDNKPLIDQFLVDSLRTSSPLSPISRSLYPLQFDSYVKLFKTSIVVNRLKLSKKQLQWLFVYGSISGDPAAAWLNLDSLPLQLVSPNLGFENYRGFERLSALVSLRDALSFGEDVLDAIFSQARSAGASEAAILETLSQATNWNSGDLKFATGPEGFGLPFPDAYKDEIGISLLSKYFALLRKVGCLPADLNDLAIPKPAEKQSRKAVQIVKAKYDQSNWNTVARPLRNILRERQRESLVSYLIAKPPGSGISWRIPSDLSAFHLIDVDMGPCQLTSRIKQATCSVQLFIQRCLMNLEPEVKADIEVDDVWTQWEAWLKTQVVSSANRQVFMYPENFLEPSLRDDKTPFFLELENDVSQNDITNDVAEQAFMNYLEKLLVVSRLEVKSYYHELERTDSGAQGIDNLHVFATTRSLPKELYYRQRQNGRIWTAWDKVDLDVESDHIVPIIWNRKLHVFWLQWTEKSYTGPVIMPAPNEEVKSHGTFWDIKMCWTERRAGRWQGKKISDSSIPIPKQFGFQESSPQTFLEAVLGEGRSAVTCRTEITTDGNLRIYLLSDKNSAGGLMGYFEFDGIKGLPTAINTQDRNLNIALAEAGPQTRINSMSFTEYNFDMLPDPSKYPDYPLALPVRIPKQAEPPTHWLTEAEATSEKVPALALTPGGPYSLVPAPQDQQFVTQRPFFFQHTRPSRSFFVEPITTFTLIGLKNPIHMSPTWLDGSILGGYIDRLDHIRPIITGPTLPDPVISGVPSMIRTFEPLNPQFNNIESGSTKTSSPQLAGSATQDQDISRPVEADSRAVFPAQVDLSSRRLPSTWTRVEVPNFKRFKFSLFYHPYAGDFLRALTRDGVPGLLQRPIQALKPATFQTFQWQYRPIIANVETNSLPDETVDFSTGGSLSQYNWELFYHVPMLIADRLNSNQHFQEAQMWLRYIFDPTDTSGLGSPMKYWKTKPFVAMQDKDYYNQNISNIFRALASRGDPAVMATLTSDQREWLNNLELSVDEWRRNPFTPFVVARMRTMAFQMATVMKYLDNLIAWGDQLFSQDTIESINEATQLYITASDILGRRPADIPTRAIPVPQTYNSLDSKLDDFSNALVRIEELVPNFSATASDEVLIQTLNLAQGTSPVMLFFCVPRNKKLLSYWDTVSDRLFKIHHCMNLHGIVRELALWDPPIDPMLLIKAKAAGADLSSVLSDISVIAPNYRYNVLAAKAYELASEVRSFGNTLLSALEKQDAEGLSLLHSGQEIALLKAIRDVKNSQVNEAGRQVDALNSGKDVITAKRDYYGSREFMNALETAYQGLETAALIIQLIEFETHLMAAGVSLVPEFKIGVPTTVGASFGGDQLSNALSKFAASIAAMGGTISKTASMTQTLAGYARRQDEWTFQKDNATKEIAQIDVQIDAATIRQAMAVKELENHDMQTDQAKEVDDYLNSKFTNQQLYSWMSKQVASLYFKAYTLAYEAAKRAERAYGHELGITGSSFIQFGYWDNLQKGLLAGERLMVDIKRLDAAYLDGDSREYEMTKNISLAHINPVALLQFKQGGDCLFDLPEAIFDLDCPGHYMRRIKSVSVTIPCITGPYTSVSVKLSLIKSSIRTTSILSTGKKQYARTENDLRFQDLYGHLQGIVTSTALNDTGTFEGANHRDERYLPFERYGVISSWKLEMPTELKQFDYGSITDVVIQLQYTAREGGDALKATVIEELKASALAAISLAESQNGLARMIDLRREQSDAWNRFLRPLTSTAPQRIALNLATNRFPYLLAAASSISIQAMELFVQIDPAYSDTHNADTLKFYLSQDGSEPEAANLITLTVWKNATLRGVSRAFAKPPGKWLVTAGLGDLVTRVKPEAVLQVFVVVHYTAKWA